eukprot:scaffold2151_cov99-Isochrysis_galbana.AAC.2
MAMGNGWHLNEKRGHDTYADMLRHARCGPPHHMMSHSHRGARPRPRGTRQAYRRDSMQYLPQNEIHIKIYSLSVITHTAPAGHGLPVRRGPSDLLARAPRHGPRTAPPQTHPVRSRPPPRAPAASLVLLPPSSRSDDFQNSPAPKLKKRQSPVQSESCLPLGRRSLFPCLRADLACPAAVLRSLDERLDQCRRRVAGRNKVALPRGLTRSSHRKPSSAASFRLSWWKLPPPHSHSRSDVGRARRIELAPAERHALAERLRRRVAVQPSQADNCVPHAHTLAGAKLVLLRRLGTRSLGPGRAQAERDARRRQHEGRRSAAEAVLTRRTPASRECGHTRFPSNLVCNGTSGESDAAVVDGLVAKGADRLEARGSRLLLLVPPALAPAGKAAAEPREPQLKQVRAKFGNAGKCVAERLRQAAEGGGRELGGAIDERVRARHRGLDISLVPELARKDLEAIQPIATLNRVVKLGLRRPREAAAVLLGRK